ncbi:unnamed protein product [Caenorhabditis sp. 36 PRJEB53466]|nr:unnamed protein product [Caenorhabditis sp. 36 PRJEB53466]
MAANNTPINFKLHLAPGAVEKFSVDFDKRSFDDFVDNLEIKLGELGLTLNVVYWKNEKGNLISLSSNSVRNSVRKMLSANESSPHVSIFAIADSSAENSSDSSSEESGDEEILVIDATPQSPRRRRHCGRRDRSRSRGFDRARSRSHSRGHSRGRDGHGPRGTKGLKEGCGKKRLFRHLAQRVQLLEAQSARLGRPCFGRRARSVSPQRRGPGGLEIPPFGRRFGPFGGHGPHGFHGHHHHHIGPFGFGGGHHGFRGHKGHNHGFGGRHHPFDPRASFGRF